jgi:opacity protein-like surface antigen
MIRKIAGLAVAATLLLAPAALAAGTAPSAPTGVTLGTKTQTTLQLWYNADSCDADGDFGSAQGKYEFQVNGVTVGQNIPTAANCTNGGQLGFTFGYGNTGNPPLKCGTGYTIRVRAVDAAGHAGTWVAITGSQGAVTLHC